MVKIFFNDPVSLRTNIASLRLMVLELFRVFLMCNTSSEIVNSCLGYMMNMMLIVIWIMSFISNQSSLFREFFLH